MGSLLVRLACDACAIPGSHKPVEGFMTIAATRSTEIAVSPSKLRVEAGALTVA